MAGASLLALLDDITTLLDDVATLSKVAVQKTSGVVGDDLALNAEQVSGFAAERELPVVWAVAKGSFVNKAILVPAALLISAFVPKLVVPLLMLGGAYLCFEGFEKVFHRWLHPQESTQHKEELSTALRTPEIDLVELERARIKGAIRTDFILSAEIIVIALGTMATAPIGQQVVALSVIGVAITVLVYGLVAGIVKVDDLGVQLVQGGGAGASFGRWILAAAPWLMRALSVGGTAAMFLVGGGIIVHGIHPIAVVVERWAHAAGAASGLVTWLLNGAIGVVAGGVLVGVVTLAQRPRARGSE
ncbi:MAG: DUF808 domain-containing protein [Gemmatimonadaceae bacterium]|nr:DUF808 domain-containing protein [Gemmatimonadaceae bacterium]